MLKSARLSKFLLPTLRQMPADADTVSAKLMLRAGMIRKVASGIYDWLPMGLIVLKKVEQIVREEMEAAGGQEVWLPVIQPKGLWVETGRWAVYGKELLRIADRKGSEFCFAPTAEEIITDLVRREIRSWRQLPLMLYQFGLKFRDEIRPRFGVMRAREFYMKDAYSFHADAGEFSIYYQRLFEAYRRIFKRCGLQFRPVEAVSGAIGGDTSHEFMVLAEAGEETIVTCAACSYAANLERAESAAESIPAANHADLLPLMEVPTPGVWTVEGVSELLRAPKSKFIKTMFYDADGRPVVALLRGDHELNEEKLTRALKCRALRKSRDAEYRDIAKCEVGFAGPAGLKERSGRADLLIVADHAVRSVVNGVSGANKNDMHLSNINLDRDYR
ncbi:MAG: proline--tRNA ligase, partial [Elusimicrobia bacterium]|nr:proline--tRNA ligase [Elusimicrobiota bacterium]